MLAKLGLILLLLMGFALAFVAGVMAPPDLRGEVSGAVDRVIALPVVTSALAAVGVEASAPAAEEAPATPFKELLVPPVPPEKAEFALRAATFDFQEPAERLAAALRALEYPTRLIPIVDRFDGRSVVVAVGEYASEREALEARDSVARRAGLRQVPPVILLPAEKEKK